MWVQLWHSEPKWKTQSGMQCHIKQRTVWRLVLHVFLQLVFRGGRKPWFIAFANFWGVNTSPIADLSYQHDIIKHSVGKRCAQLGELAESWCTIYLLHCFTCPWPVEWATSQLKEPLSWIQRRQWNNFGALWVHRKIMVASKGTYLEMIIGF